jgi:hypothetical protein
MSTSAVRLWLGWRSPAYGGDAGWANFVKELAQNFIPVTWEAMAPFELRTYVPSVLSPTGNTGLPEEVALLCYASVGDYNRQKLTIAGRCYRLLHRVPFGPASTSGWATAGAPDGKPTLRAATAGGRHFDDPAATVHFIALTHPSDASLGNQQVLDALATQAGALALWCLEGQTLVWIAASGPLDRQATVAPLLALAPGSQCLSWQVAKRAPALDQESGVSIAEQSSLHFSR